MRQARIRRPRRRSLPIALAVGLAVAFVAGCATAPVAEIRQFNAAFVAVDQVGQPLLDDLSQAERAQGRGIAARRAQGKTTLGAALCPTSDVPWQEVPNSGGFIAGYCLPDAPYFASVGDPPATKIFRGALSIVGNYASVLVALAENRNVEGGIAEINQALGDAGAVLKVVGLASSMSPIGAVVGQLEPILRKLAEAGNVETVRKLIQDGNPKVEALIVALRDAAPAMFNTITEAHATKLTSEAAENPAVAEPLLNQIGVYRRVVSDYVVLLDQLYGAWRATVAAVEQPEGRGGQSDLIRRSAEIRSFADSVRRALSALRTGGSPTA